MAVIDLPLVKSSLYVTNVPNLGNHQCGFRLNSSPGFNASNRHEYVQANHTGVNQGHAQPLGPPHKNQVLYVTMVLQMAMVTIQEVVAVLQKGVAIAKIRRRSILKGLMQRSI